MEVLKALRYRTSNAPSEPRCKELQRDYWQLLLCSQLLFKANLSCCHMNSMQQLSDCYTQFTSALCLGALDQRLVITDSQKGNRISRASLSLTAQSC